jgi:hypothetical protein
MRRISEEERAAYLRKFLEPHGVATHQLLEDVEPVYGPILLVMATGSVPAGFGNPTSDLDLIVVVDCKKLANVPLVSYKGALRVDVEYRALPRLEADIERITSSAWPDRPSMGLTEHLRYQRALRSVTRFAWGVPLQREKKGYKVLERLSGDWLPQRAAASYLAEAQRMRLIARWLVERKPLLAAQRYCDALILEIESRSAARGMFFEGPKWVFQKLKMFQDTAGESMLWEALRLPVRASECSPYFGRMESILDSVISSAALPSGLEMQLTYLPQVQIRQVGKRVLVSLWDSRAHWLPEGVSLPPVESELPVWRGKMSDAPPSHVLDLLADGMLYVGLAQTDVGS